MNATIRSDFNRTPKFMMYFLFCVDSALRPKELSFAEIDKSNLCFFADPEVAPRCLHLHHDTPPQEIVADLKEMRLTGLACVGLDGSSLAPDEIRSSRYRELIRHVHEAGLDFVHGFPFADTYDNLLTKKYPHIRQRTHDGRYPYVGWDTVNSHLNVDYGSEEFIAFCKECMDVLSELGVKAIDYAEPDHYPWDDNGYGESLAQTWTKATGRPLPHPTTLEHRFFMEDRNLHGMQMIGEYAHQLGMVDHLTESPLAHGPTLVCQSFGKLSRSNISQLSTTFHQHFMPVVGDNLELQTQMQVQSNRMTGLGCIEAKSMRDWGERHAVYCGCGQGLPPERLHDGLTAMILLHQMDVCFWDYGNFRNRSVYSNTNPFEDPAEKYAFFKKTVRETIETYLALPEDYRHAVTAPDAMIAYAKRSDYARHLDQDATKMPGWASLYAIGYKLQCSDLASMFAYDEYPEVFQRDGRDVPLLLLDGYQEVSEDFAGGVAQWFGTGKVLITGGELPEQTKRLLQNLAKPTGNKSESSDIGRPRGADYTNAAPSIDVSHWRSLRTFNGKRIVFITGDVESGLLIYSAVPLARLSRGDLAGLCDFALQQVGATRVKLTGEMAREVVRYKNGDQTFLAVKNYGAELSVLTVQTATMPRVVLPQNQDVAHKEKEGKWTTQLSFKPFEVRIISL